MDTVDAEAEYGRYVALGRSALAARRFEEAGRSGTVRRTVLIGVAALVLCEILAVLDGIMGTTRNHLAIATVVGVTVAAAIASGGRQRRERELASVRVVAEADRRDHRLSPVTVRG
jgi:hypothetical protein